MREHTQLHTQDIGALMRGARTRSGLGLRAVARRAGTSHATLSAYEKNQKVPSISTFLRILEACSYSIDITLRPRVRERHGMPRGEELAQVLELAEQFPARSSKTLDFPIFKPAL